MGELWRIDLNRRSKLLFFERESDNGDEVCYDLEEEVRIGSEIESTLADDLITEIVMIWKRK